MRLAFATSHETAALVAAIEAMSIGEIATFAALSALVGFPVHSGLAAYQSARGIALKRSGIVTASIRGTGLQRLGSVETVAKSDQHMAAIRRRARRGGRELAAAIKGNLDPSTAVEAMRRQAVFGLIESSARPASSNAARPEPPPADPPRRPGLDSIPKARTP